MKLCTTANVNADKMMFDDAESYEIFNDVRSFFERIIEYRRSNDVVVLMRKSRTSFTEIGDILILGTSVAEIDSSGVVGRTLVSGTTVDGTYESGGFIFHKTNYSFRFNRETMRRHLTDTFLVFDKQSNKTLQFLQQQ